MRGALKAVEGRQTAKITSTVRKRKNDYVVTCDLVEQAIPADHKLTQIALGPFTHTASTFCE